MHYRISSKTPQALAVRWSTACPTLAELVHTGTVNAAAALVDPAESVRGRLGQLLILAFL
jgi:hypothetical protein